MKYAHIKVVLGDAEENRNAIGTIIKRLKAAKKCAASHFDSVKVIFDNIGEKDIAQILMLVSAKDESEYDTAYRRFRDEMHHDRLYIS